jgi:hypothetical protein
MEGENEMIPMGGEDEVEGPDAPPTVKERNAAQQEVSRLLDILAPERTANRMGGKGDGVERHRTPRGCILQAPAGAVSVSWFPDSAQGAELGELQVVAWRGVVSRPGSSQRASGAKPMEEMVLRPVENRMGDLQWRATEGTMFTTDALAARCTELLEQWIAASEQQPG